MPERRVPDRERMKQYINAGLTQTQIAERWVEDGGVPVTRNAISLAMTRYGLEPVNPQNRYDDLLPWRIKTEHLKLDDARNLRLLARRRRGLPLDHDNEGRLNSWLRDLEAADAVVMYDADTPEGFWWVRREPTDEDVIRRPTEE